MRILVTGFEPFGKDTENASWEAVSRLPRHILTEDGDITIVTARLPVVFATGPDVLRAAIAEHEPDAVIAVGEAGGRTDITPEKIAKNIADARIPDNAGAQPRNERLDDGEPELLTRLPNAQIVAMLQAMGLPASESENAGEYVCNAIFRAVLTSFAGPAGFIHVPAVRSQGLATVGEETDRDGVPAQPNLSFTFADLTRALTLVCRILATNGNRAE